MTERSSSRRDTGLVAVVGIASVLPFLLAPVRAQILGPSGRGEFAFFQSSLTAAGIFSALGLRFACYELKFLVKDRFGVRTSRLIAYSVIGSAVVVAPTVWIAFNQISPFVGFAILATLLLAPGAALVQIETANANHAQRRDRIAALSSLPPLVEFIATVISVLLQKLNLFLALLITFLAETVRTSMAAVWHFNDRRRLDVSSRSFNKVVEKRLLVASFRNAPAVVTPLLSGNLDILIFAAMAPTNVLGHYAIAKLGFSVLVIMGGVLEGRFLAQFRRHSKVRGLLNVAGSAAMLAGLCGLAGWMLTPAVFGADFGPAAHAFPYLALAGGLALLFACLSAATAQEGKSSAYPGLIVLASLTAACLLVPTLVGVDVVSLTYALVFSQLVGLIVVTHKFFQGGSTK